MTSTEIQINKHARNKLLFTRNIIEGIQYIDIGRIVSPLVRDNLTESSLPMIVEEKLDSVIGTEKSCIDTLGDYVAIKNIGILFEKDLKLDLHKKIDSWSRDTVLIINLEGQIQNGFFYLADVKNKAHSCSLNNISYQII